MAPQGKVSDSTTDGEHRAATAKQQRVARAASVLTTAIEWYDYYLYGLVAGIVFGAVYFPADSEAAGTIQAFAIFFVGFIARPVGAALFGHYGDRIGRRAALIASTLCMGIPTVAVAFVPSYETIGIAGAVILCVLRIAQGVGLGGQWAGAVLVSMESGAKAKRGLAASWAQVGSPLGLILANVALLATIGATTHEQFMSWGWRIPFIASGVLIAATFYIRTKLEEPPAAAPGGAAEGTPRRAAPAGPNPFVELIRKHWKGVALAALARTSEMAPFYIFTAFVVTYGGQHLNLADGTVLAMVLIGSIASLFVIPLSGHVSDRLGRRKVYVAGAVLTAVWSVAYFPLLDTRSTVLIAVAIIVSLVPHDIQYGPQAALIAESFPPEVRYSGTALGSQLASIVSGGPAPLIAAALLAWTGSGLAIAAYLVVCSAVGAVAAALMRRHDERT